jgi:protein gp37
MPTGIQWTDETWNPLRAQQPGGPSGWACVRVSPGCVNCYAEEINSSRRWGIGTGLTYDVPSLSAVRTFIAEGVLEQPLRWSRARMVFVCSMTDLFGDWVGTEEIAVVFAIMALSPNHTFQVLTKRPGRMRALLSSPNFRAAVAKASVPYGGPGVWGGDPSTMPWPLPNVWAGVSVESQLYADDRVPQLLATPAAVRFVSYEPALEAVDFTHVELAGGSVWNALDRREALDGAAEGEAGGVLDWIIIGGESGPNARPFDPAWARAVIEQAAPYGTAVFVKQMGQVWAHEKRRELRARAKELERGRSVPGLGGRVRSDADERRAAGLREMATRVDLHGGHTESWEPDLVVRQWPAVAAGVGGSR